MTRVRDIRHALLALLALLALALVAPSSAQALASTHDAPPSGELEAFILRPPPVTRIVVQVIGAASRPEADAEAIIKAVTAFEAQRAKIAALRHVIRAGVDGLSHGGASAAPRWRRLLRRVDAHTSLASGLEGASLRRGAETALRGPMHGGKELGPAMHGLGQLLAGEVLVALAGKQTEEAAQALVRLARFGALVSDAALTLDELTSGLRAAQDALGMLAGLPGVAQRVCPSVPPATLHAARRELGSYGQGLQAARRELKAAHDLPLLATIAVTSSSALWRHEALKVLRGVAWSGNGTSRGARAEALMAAVSDNPAAPDDVREAARRAGNKLRIAR